MEKNRYAPLFSEIVALSDENLANLTNQIGATIREIDLQLSEYRSGLLLPSYDEQWRVSAVASKNHYTRSYRLAKEELESRKTVKGTDMEPNRRRYQLAKFFVKEAKRLLPDDVFQSVWNSVMEHNPDFFPQPVVG